MIKFNQQRKRLSQKQMADALELLKNIIADYILFVENHESVKADIENYLSAVKLYTTHFIFRPDLSETVLTDIFNNYNVMRFILKVQYEFYLKAGDGPDFIESLCSSLEDALLVDGIDTEINILPQDVKESTPLAFFKSSATPSGFLARLIKALTPNKVVTLRGYLRSNPLIVVVLLLTSLS